jgi:hypothetical protein
MSVKYYKCRLLLSVKNKYGLSKMLSYFLQILLRLHKYYVFLILVLKPKQRILISNWVKLS